MSATRIVDAHQHFWRAAGGRYRLCRAPAIARRFGDYSAIAGDYLPADYRRDAAGFDIAATIHVEAGYGGPSIEETQWLGRLHGECGLPAAALIRVDLAGDVAAEIRAHRAVCGGVQIVGVRQHAFWSEDARFTGIDRPDILTNPAFREGVAAIVGEGLVFEAPIYFSQWPQLLSLCEALPQGRFVLGHAAMPVHFDVHPSPFPAPEESWKTALRQLAAAPNLAIKLSGFWMGGRALTRPETNALLREAVGAFGVGRCVFGSNFPVDRLHVAFGDMIDACREGLAPFGPAAFGRVMADNACRVFGLRL